MEFPNREVRANIDWIKGQELQLNSSSELLVNDMVEATIEAPGLASGINVWIHIKNRVLEQGESLRYLAHIVRMEDSEREILDNWLSAQAVFPSSESSAELEPPPEQSTPPQPVTAGGTPNYLDAMRQRRKARSPAKATPGTDGSPSSLLSTPPAPPSVPPTPPSPQIQIPVPPTPQIQIPVPNFFPSPPTIEKPSPPPAANEDFFLPPPPAALQRKREAPAPVISPAAAQPAMAPIPEGAAPSCVLESGNLMLHWDNPNALRLALPSLLEGFFTIPQQEEDILGLRFLLPNGIRLALRIKSQNHENGQTTVYFRINQVLGGKIKSACD
jgi:hypothetical protein